MKRIILYITSILVTTSLMAEKYNFVGANDEGGLETVNIDANKTAAGDCIASGANIELDINNIRANLLAAGDFWWDGNQFASYEYPKGSGNHTLYSGALWFTGLDDANQLRCSGQTYRNAGHDFWTGPLNQFGQVEAQTCAEYDRFWEVFGDDIGAFQAAFLDAGGVTISSASIPQGILEWPGNGNPFHEGTELFYDAGSMAPYFDFDGNGIYDPTKGDYPTISNDIIEYADQMIFWVSNDNGNTHSRTTGVSIGLQINSLAFSFSTADALNDMTFYTYEIIKKSSGSVAETYMGIFVDPDNGEATDDFIGCDTVRSLGYVYNASANDGDYGFDVPITAIDFFEGPIGDNGQELGLSSFVYFTNGNGNQSDPDNAGEFRNYQTGKWKDGADITYGGLGIGGTTPTNYVYPDDPVMTGGWSECEVLGVDNGDDRRFVQNSGPFTMSAGEKQRITIGVISTMYENYQPCTDSYTSKIIPADDIAQALFDNDFGLIDGPDAPTLKIRELSNELIITLVNESGSNNIGESYQQQAVGASTVLGQDSLYRFEGYIVYQLKNAEVSAQDLRDPTKAQVVAQMDIKNGISSITNFVEGSTGFYTPEYDEPNVEGADEGIMRSIRITRDKFSGVPLTNHKTYYFAAVAYAHNDYLSFYYPPFLQTPQIAPYLQGRGNFNKYTGIPHDIGSTNGGTQLNAEFGESVPVRRLEGQGNGGNQIGLSQETEMAILESALGFIDVLEYEVGEDPIGLTIVDPLELKDVDFELLIKSYEYNSLVSEFVEVSYFSDSTVWILNIYDNGQLIETVNSLSTIDKPYEQYIDGYGITLNVGIPIAVNTNENNGNDVYDILSSSIAFENPAEEWLTFIQDESGSGSGSSADWIRSGDLKVADPANVYDSYQYTNSAVASFLDADSRFEGLLDGNFAPYCLAANYANNSPTGTAPKYVYGPGFKHDIYNPVGSVTDNINTLDRLQSVVLVLTPDKTMWSRTVVFETGEDTNLTINGARKGDLRKSTSKDADGNEIVGQGMSYFPGYAINKETGERLIVAFGESSERIDNNGGDMLWNPTSKEYDALGVQDAIFGGKHFIYVLDRVYTDANVNALKATFDAANFTINTIDAGVAQVYEDILYTTIPMQNVDEEGNTIADFTSVADGLVPNTVRIELNVETAYDAMLTSETSAPNANGTMPRYGFSTVGLAPVENDGSIAEELLDNIRVVPNPYYAYSSYESSPLDNLVKVTNLPNECTVSIYTMDGKLVRRIERAVGDSGASSSTRQEVNDGQLYNINDANFNLDNSVTWDLKNQSNILVGSGVYIIHVSAPGVGEQVVKAAVYMRPTDVTNF